jgi:hypothetical protein
MASPLRQWRGAFLAVRCDGASHAARILHWSVEELEAKKPGLTAGAWAKRLRCKACGCRPDGVALRVPEKPGRLGPMDQFAPLTGPRAPGSGGTVDQVESVTRTGWWSGNPMAGPRRSEGAR